ncbi:MAG: quercetin dioxygenase-like cupin family protein [Sulfurimonas sp.]|jgi:quercetin dioxygenase-like cupin family protein
MKKNLLLIATLILTSTLAFAHENTKIKVDVLAKTSSSWDGTALKPYAKGTPEVTILKISIPPKTKLPIHKHPYMNAGVLTKGQLTVVTIDKKVLELKAGDAIVETIDKWHYGENRGNTTSEIIVIYAGIKGQAITIKK